MQTEPQKAKKKIVLIGCSAGGPRALAILFKGLPQDISVPIIIAQHIPRGFSQRFAEWLQGNCAMKVREAHNGEFPSLGVVHIVPAGHNMTFLPSGTIHLEPVSDVVAASSSPFCPSITQMMKSAAAVFRTNAIGILLTGIGDDGAEGLLAIKKAGGYTIVEDVSTCWVFGMPKKAIEIGAALESLPCFSISERILKLVR